MYFSEVKIKYTLVGEQLHCMCYAIKIELPVKGINSLANTIISNVMIPGN